MNTRNKFTLSLTLAAALSAAVFFARAQTTAPAAPSSLRPVLNDTQAIYKLVLALESGPPQAVQTRLKATADGNAVLPARSNRARWAMMNRSNETVYFDFVPGVTSAAWPVPAGASTSMQYTGPVYVFSASGSAAVVFNEGVYP